MNKTRFAFLLAHVLGWSALPVSAATYFVAPTPQGSNNGTSAADAWGVLQTALNTAWTTAGDHTINIAAGTYQGVADPGDSNWYDDGGNLGYDFFVDGVLSFREAGVRQANSISFVGAGVGSTFLSSAGSSGNFSGSTEYPFFVVDQAANFTGITMSNLKIDISGGAVDVLFGIGDPAGGGTNVSNLGFTFDNVAIELDTEKLLAMDDVGAPNAIQLVNGSTINTNRAIGNLSFIEIDNTLGPPPVADIVVLDASSSITRAGGPLALTDLAAIVTQGANIGDVYLNGYNGPTVPGGYNGGTADILAYDGRFFVSQVPEPSGALLITMALGTLLVNARRKCRR